MSYIKLDRKTLEWEWFTDPSTAHLWIYFLLKANHKGKEWQGIKIDEGCLVTSEARIVLETGLSRQQVRTAMKRLVTTKEITKVSTKTYTLIKINKWAKYQLSVNECNQEDNQETSQEDNQDLTHSVTSGATHSVTTTKEYKNTRSKEKEIYKENLDCSPEFAEALEAYEEMRKKIRKPLTVKAKQMVLKKLESMAPDEETQIAILNQSTMNSWQGIFPLQDQRRNGGMSIDIMNL